MATETNPATAVVPEERKLSTQLERRGVDAATWSAVTSSIFPGGATASVLMALDYCKARGLDILKKPVHIVPMRVNTGRKDSNGYDIREMRDVIMPGIVELRTTAMRTKEYAGMEPPVWGPPITFMGVTAPSFCTYTVYRYGRGNEKLAFHATAYFEEAAATTGKADKQRINEMWTKRPRGQLEKCAEAAALRKAFPEELGGISTDDEMSGQQIVDPDQSTVVSTVSGGQTVQAGTPRTSAAADALRAKLEKKQPAEKARDEEWTAAAGQQALPADPRKEAKAKQVPSIETAIAQLCAPKTEADLRGVWTLIVEAFEFAGQDMPIDIEACFDTRLEMIREGQV